VKFGNSLLAANGEFDLKMTQPITQDVYQLKSFTIKANSPAIY
jgi:hypothetical protein